MGQLTLNELAESMYERHDGPAVGTEKGLEGFQMNGFRALVRWILELSRSLSTISMGVDQTPKKETYVPCP
jgi:hypothetical protein